MVKNYFKKIIRKIIRIYSIPVFVEPYSINSYSQYQEDLIIDSYFKNKLKGSYVDIGAYDPNDLSNTKKFYLRGWSGINIDPNLSAIDNFNQERDRDINLNIGISLIEGKEVFYEMNYKTLSTFSINDAIQSTKIYKGAKIINSYEVYCKKLSTILDDYKINIDFLSIDVEGYELQVLYSNNWQKHRPELIIIEINRNTSEIFNYMKSIDYKLIYNNHTNGIFLDFNKIII